jgi:hypothetical protein
MGRVQIDALIFVDLPPLIGQIAIDILPTTTFDRCPTDGFVDSRGSYFTALIFFRASYSCCDEGECWKEDIHCVQTPCRHTLAYVRLHGSKCVDRPRQGDIGTALPTFTYIRLRRPTSCRHTSPKCVHSHRHILVPPTHHNSNFDIPHGSTSHYDHLHWSTAVGICGPM